MQPSEDAIREELRRAAAQVTIPDNMWANINRRLDNRRPWWWQASLIGGAVAGILWFSWMPGRLGGGDPTVVATLSQQDVSLYTYKMERRRQTAELARVVSDTDMTLLQFRLRQGIMIR